jgi:hypothetical protein
VEITDEIAGCEATVLFGGLDFGSVDDRSRQTSMRQAEANR